MEAKLKKCVTNVGLGILKALAKKYPELETWIITNKTFFQIHAEMYPDKGIAALFCYITVSNSCYINDRNRTQ